MFLPRPGTARTFAEIGAELGCSEAEAKQEFERALYKVRLATARYLRRLRLADERRRSK
jgi:hypothetical protein